MGLVSICFETTETLVNFCHVSVHFKNVSKHQKWGLFQFVSKQLKCSAIFIIFSAFQSFNFVSKRFETTETFGLSQFSSCFSPFQFCPYIIHCFSVSKHQKWGLVFSPFPELVSILFRNVSRNGAWCFQFFQSLFQFCFETFRNN